MNANTIARSSQRAEAGLKALAVAFGDGIGVSGLSTPWSSASELDALMGLPTDSFRRHYWREESFSKAPWTVEGVDRERAAFEKFFEAEEVCRQANVRLLDHLVPSVAPHGVIRRARELVAGVLGKFSWDACYPHFSFGPGATSSIRRRLATHAHKWELGTHITTSCLPLHLAFLRYTGVQPSSNLTVVDGNVVTTVPKNWKTDRTIAIEPDWNMFYQRGIGGLIRQRVRSRLRLLTKDAQDRHKHLARLGSVTRDLATLDLSMASDTLSIALCEALLPADWFRAVMTTRSAKGCLQGETFAYEKISSMGNGFTFELETLIFWALTRAISRDGIVSVYGDDIICQTHYAPAVVETLQAAGFELNLGKSHYSVLSPFRESCGGHFYRGDDVTPPYFRRFPSDGVDCNTHANAILGGALRLHDGLAHHSDLFPAWELALGKCTFFGPEGLGSAVAVVPFDFPRGKRRSRRRFNSKLHRLEVRGLVPKRDFPTAQNHWGGVLASLHGKVSEESIYFRHWSYTPKWLPATSWTGPVTWV